MTLPNFSYPSKLHSKLTEAPPEKNGPRDIQNQHIHLTCQHKSFQSSSNPSSRSESCSTKTCDANEKKILGPFLVYLECFGLHHSNCQISRDLPPPKTKRCKVPRFAIPFFFSAPPGPLLLGLVGFVGFFLARNLQDLIWKFLFLCMNVNDMDVSKNSGTPKSSILIGFSITTIHFGVSLAIHMGFLQDSKNLARSWKAPLTEDVKIFRQIFSIVHRAFTWKKSFNSHLSWDFSLCPDVHFLDWI